MTIKNLTKIALTLVALTFIATPAFAQDAMSCSEIVDMGGMKSKTHRTKAEVFGADDYFGENRRFVWGLLSHSAYVSDDVYVEISCDLDSNCIIEEDGEVKPEGRISAEAAELIVRLNHQMRRSSARIPESVVNTSVNCGILWSGSAPVLDGCIVEAWNTPYFD
jgi:NDP-sugar pyrophosphorylase family protein